MSAKVPEVVKDLEVIFDLETDGLLPELTKVHCLGAIDINTGDRYSFGPREVDVGVRFLSSCKALVGHNILGFDLLVLEQLYPKLFKCPPIIYDTLVMCKVLWPADTLIARDMRLKFLGRLPPRLIKSQSLGAWGYRMASTGVGTLKQEYDGGWETWTPAMQSYMMQDCKTNLDLWNLITERAGWYQLDAPKEQSSAPPNRPHKQGLYVWPPAVFDVEQRLQVIIQDQTSYGFKFDLEGAYKLVKRLKRRSKRLERTLERTFGSWWHVRDDKDKGYYPKRDTKTHLKQFPNITRRRFSEKTPGKELKPYVGPPIQHQHRDAPFVRIKRIAFLPSSRDHVGQRLMEQYGWHPKSYGANGKPNVDEGTIRAIPDDVIPKAVKQSLIDYFVVTKTLGQLYLGRKSLIKVVSAEYGRIHGRMNTCGAITGRGTHFMPNLSQVPKAKHHKGTGKVLLGLKGAYGYEMRSLFVAAKGNELTGTDVSGLELALLGHYLAPLDGGQLAARMSDPQRDVHTEHSELTGLDRDATKTVTYCKIYGGGVWKVGSELDLDDSEIEDLLKYPTLPVLLKFRKKFLGKDYKEPSDNEKASLAKGHMVIKRFDESIPGLKDLVRDIRKTAESRAWLKGIDGRKLFIRKPYAALSTLLQGAGAVVCKLWIVLLHEELAKGSIRGVHQVVWSHDEVQLEHPRGLGPEIATASQIAIERVGKQLGLRVKLRVDTKTGLTWAKTH